MLVYLRRPLTHHTAQKRASYKVWSVCSGFDSFKSWQPLRMQTKQFLCAACSTTSQGKSFSLDPLLLQLLSVVSFPPPYTTRKSLTLSSQWYFTSHRCWWAADRILEAVTCLGWTRPAPSASSHRISTLAPGQLCGPQELASVFGFGFCFVLFCCFILFGF